MSRKWVVISQCLLCSILILVLLISPSGAPGAKAWSGDPTENTAICTASGYQEYAAMVSDGSGGAIITWEDKRSGTYDIYAQRVDSSGAPQWAADGVAICTASDWQRDPAIVSDGSGGAIIAWEDRRSGTDWDIYAQRVDSSGTTQWIADGVAICTASEYQADPAIVSDVSGGAVITWRDRRSGTNYDIYAQRVDSAGTLLWADNGVAICTATSSQVYPAMVSDGSGGAIIAWEDYRSGTDWDIYAQRVDSMGTPQWTADGVAICTALDHQRYPAIVRDGSGGAIIAWTDERSGTYTDIYAQRVDSSGTTQWIADGVAVCTASGGQWNSAIVSDGSGGAVITWHDFRNGINTDIYAHRVDSAGTLLWADDGVAICTALDNQYDPKIVSDGSGGAIITWRDERGTDYDIYAQRLDSMGTPQWTADGVAICTALDHQRYPAIVRDGSGGAIITWQDHRGTNSDIYAQRVNADGLLQGPPSPYVHAWTLYAAGFFPKHLPDSYTGQVVLANLELANIPPEVQGVWWYDPAIMDYRFWVPGVGGDLTTLTGQFYNYMVLVTGACGWEIPLP